MNHERIAQLADYISELPAVNFDMSQYLIDKTREDVFHGRAKDLDDFHKCGTVGCIAGWETFKLHKEGVNVEKIAKNSLLSGAVCFRIAAESFGLNTKQAQELFVPWSGHRDDNRLDLSSYTKRRCVAVLHHLAATSEIAWDKFNSRGRPID